jgi:hypothetical protein
LRLAVLTSHEEKHQELTFIFRSTTSSPKTT